MAAKPPVGRNLSAEMMRLGLTNEAAARLADIPERQIRRWRNEETSPSWEQVLKLAQAFGRPASWFYVEHGKGDTNTAAA